MKINNSIVNWILKLFEKPKPNDLENCFDTWKIYRKELIYQKIELEKTIDKTVFIISSGSIGISLLVLDKLSISENYKNTYILLGFGWFFLIISLIYQILSLVFTSKRIKNSILFVENIFDSETFEDAQKVENSYYDYWKLQNQKIDKDNQISLGCMIAGIIFILAFSFISLFSNAEQINQPKQIVTDSSIIKQNIMSKSSKPQNTPKKDSNQNKQSKPQKGNSEGKLEAGKQSHSIINPPIKTKPKEKRN